MSSTSDIEEYAAQWLLRREEPGWSDNDQAALDAWLSASTFNRVAYYRLEFGWRRADRLAALKAPSPLASHARFSARQFGAAAAIALATVAGVMAGVWHFRDGGDRVAAETYRTDLGGRASLALEDGSHVELNTDSELRTALSDTSRTAWLDEGEAYFAVAHDRSRPFVIHAGSRLVRVLGTKFSVRRDGSALIVMVLEGRVEVDASQSTTVIATPGDIVTVQGDVATVRYTSEEEVMRALDWRQGLLSFDRTALAEVAKEFNRYNRRKLVVDASAANAIHVGGTFDAKNVDAFARLLQDAYGLRVKDAGAAIEISNKNPSP